MQKETITKRKQTYLTNAQKWEVASYCIEHRNVIQDIDSRIEIEPTKFYPYSIWRVTTPKTAEEVNKNLYPNGPKVTSHHIKQSIEFLNEVSELTGRFPEPKAVVDTVEMDQLTAKNKQLGNTIKDLEEENTRVSEFASKYKKEIEELKVIIQNMASQVPADIWKRIKYRS